MFTGEKLRLLRQARGLKQQELARKMGIQQQRVSALENSKKIPASQTAKIYSALNLSSQQAEIILSVLYLSPPAVNGK